MSHQVACQSLKQSYSIDLEGASEGSDESLGFQDFSGAAIIMQNEHCPQVESQESMAGSKLSFCGLTVSPTKERPPSYSDHREEKK